MCCSSSSNSSMLVLLLPVCEWTQLNQDYGLSAHTYITNCVGTLESMCEMTFTLANTPFDANYYPEENTSKLCCPEEHSWYCSLSQSINWCIILGHFNVYYAFNALSQYSVAPRKEYFATAQHIFGYLKKHPTGICKKNKDWSLTCGKWPLTRGKWPLTRVKITTCMCQNNNWQVAK